MEFGYWYVCGLIGTIGIWLGWWRAVEETWPSCPTLRACFGMLVFAVAGPFAIAGAAIVWLVETSNDDKDDSPAWWNKPVCDFWRRR